MRSMMGWLLMGLLACSGSDKEPEDSCADADADGVCDADDQCEGSDDAVDEDGDGVADGCDDCPLDALDDSDGDGVCDSDDLCAGDDTVDTDGDGVADDCDPCPFDPLDDSDGDGTCDADDLCMGGDDRIDTDADGNPDACDACPQDEFDDRDLDGVCDSVDLCQGGDDAVDVDQDGVPDACAVRLLATASRTEASVWTEAAMPDMGLVIKINDQMSCADNTEVGGWLRHVDGASGSFDFDSTNDANFADFAACATDNVDGSLIVGYQLPGGGIGGRGDAESISWDADITGAEIRFVRLHVQSLSIQPEVMFELDGSMFTSSFTWEVYGVPYLPLPSL